MIAIVAIDLQNGFITDATRHLPAAVACFLQASKMEHRIFTRFKNEGCEDFYYDNLGWRGMTDPHDVKLVPELENMPTFVLQKNTYSSMLSDDLGDYLKANSIDKVYICGVDTNVCVTMLTMELIDARLEPVIVSDLCGSHSGESYHLSALHNLELLVGKANMMTANEALRSLPC